MSKYYKLELNYKRNLLRQRKHKQTNIIIITSNNLLQHKLKSSRMNLLSRLTLFKFASQKKPLSLYQTLRIPRTASHQQIKSNYYKLAKQYHPDTHQQKPNIAQTFKQINEAYNILKDPAKRRQYDEQNFTAQGDKKEYKFYNTQHTYGYNSTQSNSKNYRKNPYQTTNPFESAFNSENSYRGSGTTNPYNGDFSSFNPNMKSSNPETWDEYVQQQHRKNVAENRKIGLDRQRKSNIIMGIIIGLVSVYFIGEFTFKIYEFNSFQRVRSYDQRLDPNDLRQYQNQLRFNRRYGQY